MTAYQTSTTRRRSILIARPGPQFAALPIDVWHEIGDDQLDDLSTPDLPARFGDSDRTRLVAHVDEVVVFPAGLVDRVRGLLEQRGYDVTMPQWIWRIYDQSPAAEQNRGRLTSLQREFLDASEGQGAVLATGVDPSQQVDLVNAICARFDPLNIAVAAASNRAAQRFVKRMRSSSRRHIECGLRPEWHFDNMIYVGTPGTAPYVDHWGFQILVWLGPAPMPAELANALLRRVCTIWFGLITQRLEDLHPVDALAIEAMFGPSRLDLSRPRDLLTDVTVSWLSAPPYPALQCGDALKRKRAYFWQNERRNRLIAQAATSLAAMDAKSLVALGVAGTYAGQPPVVAVVCENVEHASQLMGCLPGWTLVAAPKDVRPFHEIPLRSVVTLPVASRRGINADVVVYAAGDGHHWIDGCGPSWLKLGGSMAIVDMWDDLDPIATAQCQARARDYRRRGWKVATEGPAGMSSAEAGWAEMGRAGKAHRGRKEGL